MKRKKRGAFSFFCIFIILLIIGWGMLIKQGIERTIKEETLVNVAQEHNLFNWPQIAIKQKAHEAMGDSGPSFLPDAIISALDTAFEAGWVKEETEQAIPEFTAYFRGEQENLSIVIDLRERKKILAEEIAASLKSFLEEDLISGNELGNDRVQGLLRQLLQDLELLDEQVDRIAKGVVQNLEMEDEFYLVDLMQHTSGQQTIGQLRSYYIYLRVFPYLLLFTVAVVLLIKGLWAGLMWIGGSMLCSGLSFYLFIQGSSAYLYSFVDNKVIEASLGVVPAEIDLAGAMREVMHEFVKHTGGASFIYAGAGLGLLMLGFFLQAFWLHRRR